VASTRRVIVIGRGSGCDVVLADDSVSRRHAELRLEPEGWTLVDLQSSNGTFVIRGGRRARCARELITRHDRLRFGTVETSLPEIFGRLGMSAPAAPAPPAAATVQAPSVQPPPP
jgi:pSer/pThr/pTyr-binding forkhead associated (FHA) protein